MLTISFATHARPPVSCKEREVNAWRDSSGRVFARGFTQGDDHRVVWPGLGSLSFRRGTMEVRVHLEPGASRPIAVDAVQRVLQPMILQALGYQALHASAVVPPGGVMALCGRSGNGKSTLARALASRGLPQFSDDAVVLQVGPDGTVALPLPFRPRLRDAEGRHLDTTGTKAIQASGPAPLRVVVVLEQSEDIGPTPILDTIPPAEAFSALVTHAHCFDPGSGPGSAGLVRDLMTVAARVPVHRMRYAPDPDRQEQVEDTLLHVARAAGLVTPPAVAPGGGR